MLMKRFVAAILFLILSAMLFSSCMLRPSDGVSESQSESESDLPVFEYGGTRLLIVSDNHYAIGKSTRVGARTGKVYKTERINSNYASTHNAYGYDSEAHIQALIDTVKKEHAREPIDAVMVLGDMTDMDFWYKYFMKEGLPSDLGDTNGDGEIDFDDIYKSDYDELYYVKTEYFDQLLDFSYENENGEVLSGSIPCFFTQGNHDHYRREWFSDLFIGSAEPTKRTAYSVNDAFTGNNYTFDGISVYWETDTDYAVYFDKGGTEDLAFFMMNSFTGSETYEEIYRDYLLYGDGKEPAQTMSGVWAYPELAEESENALSGLLSASRDYKQIYIGTHYISSVWKDKIRKNSSVKAIYVGDAHTETDMEYADIPLYIDGSFSHTFNTLYRFMYNFAAEPWGYMMLESKSDRAESYRVHAEMEYCISEQTFFRHKEGDKDVRPHADRTHKTDGVYAAMTAEEFVKALFEETVAVMGENSPGTLDTRDGKTYYSVEYARYKLLGKNAQSGKEYDGKYVFTVER